MPKKIFNLHFFDEGETAGAESASVDLANPSESTDSGEVASSNADASQITTDEPVPEETFESLIAGKFKKDYDKAIKTAINKRFRNQKDLQKQVDSIDPIIRAVANKYGVQATEDGSIPIDALHKALLDDDSMYEQEAFERGMSVGDLKQIKKLEAENQQLKMANARDEQQKEWEKVVAEGENLKQTYPSFDLDVEMSNPDFGRLFATMQKSGFPNALQTAYEAVHREEIMSGAMQYAVQKTQENISKSIQSGMRRPQENGASRAIAAASTQIDPSKLTKSQVEEIKMRAARGERITF